MRIVRFFNAKRMMLCLGLLGIFVWAGGCGVDPESGGGKADEAVFKKENENIRNARSKTIEKDRAAEKKGQ